MISATLAEGEALELKSSALVWARVKVDPNVMVRTIAPSQAYSRATSL